MRRDSREFLSLFLCRVRTHEEGGHLWPGREPSPEPNHASTLISDFQSTELWENKFLFKPPSHLSHFVMTAHAKITNCQVMPPHVVT